MNKKITTHSAPPKPQMDVIDLGRLFGILQDGKKIIFALTGSAIIIGICIALLSTPIYKADALLQVEKKQNGFSVLGDVGEMLGGESSSTTEIELISSRMNLINTVNKFNLTTIVTPNYFPIIGKGLERLLGNNISISVNEFNVKNPLLFQSDFIIEVIDDLSETYMLKNENGEEILTGKVGELAHNDLVKIHVNSLNAKNGDEIVLTKIKEYRAIELLREHLSISERGKNTGILELSLTGENPELTKELLNDIINNYFLQNVARQSEEAEKSLVFISKSLPEIKENLDNAENNLNNYKKKNKSVDLGLEAKSVLDLMVEIESKLNEVYIKESEISRSFTTKHPVYSTLLDEKKLLEDERDRLLSQTKDLPTTQQDILRLTRDVEVNQQIYLQLLNRAQELQIIKAGTVGNVRVVDHALVMDLPIKPKKSLIVVLSSLIGFMLSVAIVLLRASFNRGVDNPSQIEELGLAVLTCIPKSIEQEKVFKIFSVKKDCHPKDVLLSELNPADLSIEALRGLRTSLHFSIQKAKNNIMMITGSSPSVGKSFISSNLSDVFTKAGKRVLLIDADLRKGYLQRYFGLDWDQGLSDYLAGKIEIEDCVKATKIEGLDIITRGKLRPNASELLSTELLPTILTWASEQYDLVVVDSPPVLAVTDPSIIGQYVGTALMVGRFEKTTLKEIEVAYNTFAKSGIDVDGFILNFVEKRARNAHDANYSYYNYEYVQ